VADAAPLRNLIDKSLAEVRLQAAESAPLKRETIDVASFLHDIQVGAALEASSATADQRGVGLGLAITRRSVEADGGKLSVRDIPGHGCIFTIDMPRFERRMAP